MGGIAMIFLLPFDEDVLGWGHRAATTCLAISAASVGVGFFSFEPSVVPSGFVGSLSAIPAMSFGNQGSIWITFFGYLFQS